MLGGLALSPLPSHIHSLIHLRQSNQTSFTLGACMVTQYLCVMCWTSVLAKVHCAFIATHATCTVRNTTTPMGNSRSHLVRIMRCIHSSLQECMVASLDPQMAWTKCKHSNTTHFAHTRCSRRADASSLLAGSLIHSRSALSPSHSKNTMDR